MVTYKSKIGYELIIPLATILVGICSLMMYHWIWGGAVIILAIAVCIVHLFSTTYYEINGDSLRIKSGFLYQKTLPIASIKKIIETRNSISSPALSLDRIELIYNRFDSVLISPADKVGFIAELLRIKLDIEVRLKTHANVARA